jgi:ATP-dependent Clp protease ATP-binding subunit ClpC
VFERFTDRARRVLVLAQEESRLLNHNHIGTEHILLGLVGEGRGVAAKALTQMGVSLDVARQKVVEVVGQFGTEATGSPPFTPRAKKVLELSLREALQLDHNYIGTEHLLLGLVREGEGVGARVLLSVGVDQDTVRQTVMQLLAGQVEPEAASSSEAVEMTSGGWIARGGSRRRARDLRCSFCGRQPSEVGRLIAGQDAYICEHCIDEFSKDMPATGNGDGVDE